LRWIIILFEKKLKIFVGGRWAFADIHGCLYSVLAPLRNFGMSAALRPVLGAFQPSLPPAPLREKKAPSESCWPVDFRAWMPVPLYRFILSVSFPPFHTDYLSPSFPHVIANNVCIRDSIFLYLSTVFPVSWFR